MTTYFPLIIIPVGFGLGYIYILICGKYPNRMMQWRSSDPSDIFF